MLRRCASSYGRRVAIVGDAGDEWTYAELDRVTDALACGLAGLGLKPGERVMWLERNCVEYLVAYFATAKAGLVFSPLNYWLRGPELEGLIDLVQPACLMAGGDYMDTLDGLTVPASVRARVGIRERRVGWTPWADVLATAGSIDRVPNDEHAQHEIIFTSGTTGQAKGVCRSQRKRIIDSIMSALAFEVTRNEHMVFFGPQFHVGGGSVPNQALVQGGKATIITFDTERVGRAIADGATYLIGVPAHYNLLFESGALDGVDTSSVRGCYVGGSVATDKLFAGITSHFEGTDLVHGYGSTESGPHTMALRGQEFLDHRGALGLPVPGNEVRVADPLGADVPAGDVGELLVRSDTVMDHYLDRPDLTEAAFHPGGWLRTGDLVAVDQDGYYRLAGRAKEMIISGGENIYPKEIEDVLAEHDAIAEVAVIGIPDPLYEERAVAVVRLRVGQTATEDELRAFVRARLAGFKTPREVRFIEDFPRTPVGKIAKSELSKAHGSVFSA
jgi:fatty-acyl-CoA synthase